MPPGRFSGIKRVAVAAPKFSWLPVVPDAVPAEYA